MAVMACFALEAGAQSALPFIRIDRNPRSSALAGAGMASVNNGWYAAFGNAAQLGFQPVKGDVGAALQLWEMSNDVDKTTNIQAGAGLRFGSFGNFPSPELIEDIFHFNRSADRIKREVNGVCLAVFQIQGGPLFFSIQMAATGSQHDIFDILVQFYLVTAVPTCIQFAVRAIRTHQPQFCIRKRVTCFVRDSTFHDKLHLWQGKPIDFIISFLVPFVGRKESVLCVTCKSDTEIVSDTVESRSHII